MLDLPSKFIEFDASASEMEVPDQFTFPFYYDPHPLSVMAAEDLQSYIRTQQDWEHDFGDETDLDSYSIGKMFGVLVVRHGSGKLGYLAGFSGKLADSNHHERFVPPVYDMLEEGDFFLEGMKVLNEIQAETRAAEADPAYQKANEEYRLGLKQGEQEIKDHKKAIKEGKAARKLQRSNAKNTLSEEDYRTLDEQLSKESQMQRLALKHLKIKWQHINKENAEKLAPYQASLNRLKDKRAAHSSDLQRQIFEHYKFLNVDGEIQSLNDIFAETGPKAGAGECAAPKLLQYAFQNNLQPICMAEFWWGKSPKSAIRKHQQYYPACRGKCEPILGHMLKGIELEPNPLLVNPAIGKKIEILYDDEHIVIINKPADMLSVPGIKIKDSASSRIEALYPESAGPFVIHRLDMSTSGIMIFTKTKKAHEYVQRQFITRTVRKRYVALLDGYLKVDGGEIDLPLRVDLEDRPRQLVCYDHGKPAMTSYEVIERKKGTTRVYFYPMTGRTHQLRVHASHSLGLGLPIVGDDLYGKKADRLHLHAERLEFTHPVSRERMVIQIDPEF